MIVFENQGEIDPRLITTMGLNVKECEAPIGFFGTGLKYAIAVLLREDQRITIQSGESKYRFATQSDLVRGKEFEFITMAVDLDDPWPLGFTTELGKNWGLREAYRELHCNALDEGGKEAQEVDEAPAPMPGVTRVLVQGQSFTHMHHSRDQFILNATAHPMLHTTSSIEIRLGKSKSVFYRGIKVYEAPREYAYTYNILEQLKLTEDRTASEWQVNATIRSYLTDDEAMAVLVTDAIASEGLMEQELNFNYNYISPQFARITKELMVVKPMSVNRSAIEVYYKGEGGEPDYEDIPLTLKEKLALGSAQAWCKAAGFAVEQWKVRQVKSLGERVLAKAQSGMIFLTPQCFERGLLREVLLEEHVHLAHRVGDCSREMQNVLFGHIVRLGQAMQSKGRGK